MFRALLLILMVMSSFAFAQTEEKPQAIKLDEFETATNGYVKMKMDAFFVELNNNPSAQGFIVNFGTDREISVREKQIENAIRFRNYTVGRIWIARGGFRGVMQTQFWIVPPGAETPEPELKARKIDEFEKINTGEMKARLDSFFIELNNNPDSQAYIVNYGSAREVLAREKQIKSYIAVRKFDLSKVKFIKGGTRKVIKTELWIDSPKADSK